MTDPKTYSFNTKTLHSGHQPDKNFGSRAVPIYQTTSYLFQDADHAAAPHRLPGNRKHACSPDLGSCVTTQHSDVK